jgi:hypothetical protein
MTKQKRILVSFACGILITVVLAVIGFTRDSRREACPFIWQACLTYRLYRAPDMPDGRYREGTPIDGIVVLFGLSLGVPIYGLLTYAALTLTDKSKK